ncbi:hypothetical protein AB1Y20_016244 [Prymnesium parvum]|uniref:Transcription initiation factor IIA subunit 1 n=1 Tax=Prymnesium parvum TaxID=97485 RepID=A0AB34IEN4_PRYPA
MSLSNPKNPTQILYSEVIEAVVRGLREAAQADDIDDDVVELIEKTWRDNLIQSGVLRGGHGPSVIQTAGDGTRHIPPQHAMPVAATVRLGARASQNTSAQHAAAPRGAQFYACDEPVFAGQPSARMDNPGV